MKNDNPASSERGGQYEKNAGWLRIPGYFPAGLRRAMVVGRTIFGFLCGAICPANVMADQVPSRLAETLEKAKLGKLEAGMSAQELVRIVGLPDNADWDKRYLAGERHAQVWLKVDRHANAITSWKEVLSRKHDYGVGHYYVIVNGHLESPVPALTTKGVSGLVNIAQGRDPSAPPRRNQVLRGLFNAKK